MKTKVVKDRAMRDIPIVAVVGKSNAGKTTLIEGIVAVLAARGWRVGTIKHSYHDFEIDHEGKDSWRHRRAGAKLTILTSARQVAFVGDADRDMGIEELCARFVVGVDLVIVEGFKVNPFPKIEVFRSLMNSPLLCESAAELMAVVSDVPLELGVPCIDATKVDEVADLIEERLLSGGEMRDGHY